MEFDLNPLNFGFEIDPITGITINSGLVSVEAALFGNTSIQIAGDDAVNVDFTEGTNLSLFGSELVDVDLSNGISVGVADELVGVGITEEATTVEVADGLVDVDLSESTSIGVGDELVFADMGAGIDIGLDDLTGFDSEIFDII